MAKTIKGSEIIEDGHLKNAITQAETLKKVYSELDTQIKKTASTAKSGLGGVNPNSAKGIQQINAEVQKSINLKKQSKTVTDQLRKAEDLEVQGRLKLAEANRKQRAELKLKIQLENSEAGSLNRLSLNVKKYEQELRKLNLTTKDGRLRQQELIAKINQSNAVFKKNSSALSQSRINVGRYSSALKGAKASLTSFAGALGLTSGVFLLAQGLRAGVTALVDFDEALADIQKTTGLTKEAAKTLSLELSKIDTRTAISGLQELAVSAGRLGIKGVSDIKGFVKSADKLFVALGDDISGSAEEIATMIGKIADLGGSIDKFGVEKGLLKVGSVINELAANTKATANEIVNFTTRVSGIGKILNIPTSDIAALGATFADSGLSMEVAGTHINNTLASISKNMGAFAKLSGLSVEEFKEKFEKDALGTLRDLTVQAKESGDGLSGFTDLLTTLGTKGGARVTQVLATLAVTQEEFTKNQLLANEAFENGTSLTEEFDVKNQTLSASMDKLTNATTSLFLNLAAGKSDMSKMIISFVDGLTAVINLANGLEQTDEKLKKIPFGEVTVKIKNFSDTWLQAFGSLDNFKNALTDTLDIVVSAVTNFLTLGQGVENFSDLMWGAEEAVTDYEKAQRDAIHITALAQTGIKKYGEAVTEYTAKEQKRIDLLVNGNLTQEQRNELITELTDKYPELLKDYDLENLTQEQAIELQKKLRKEIIETAIVKQKVLAQQFIDAEFEKEKAKAQNITDSNTKAQRIKDLEDTKKFAEQKVDLVADEARIRLGILKKFEDDKKVIEGEGDTGTGGSGGPGGGNKPEVEIDLIPVVDGLPLEDYKFSEHTNQISEQIIDDVDNIGEEIESTVGKDSLNVFTRFYHEWQLMSEENKEKLIDDVKELADQTTELFKGVAESINMELDASIEQSQNRITDSEERINDLKQQAQLGNLDAQESVKAEKQAIANERENIEALEKKKRNLQILVTGLNLANQKIQSGDGNALASASGEMGGFISTLKGFYKGTETTLGADLGNAYAISGDKDTHIIKAHKDEHIIGVDNSRKLGKMKQSDIVKGALMLKNGEFVGRRAINAVNSIDAINDERLVKYQQKTIQAINNIQIPEHKFNYDALSKIATETIRIGNKTTNNHKPMF